MIIKPDQSKFLVLKLLQLPNAVTERERSKFGDAIEGKSIYYKDVNMKQRHVAYPIFHVDNMTKTESCIPTP
ncbi:hypothetical protein [Candidatus Marithrix sp. Canyon 246]|uniref:hypothetical protein n=1 Tax=Candidatus Marithrix sp. Canyon 246 TaxID=1827136 RepID=UPI00114CD1DF|nr:hypothetical protein [Candidatus Marithrix sp. Canyon 246]